MAFTGELENFSIVDIIQLVHTTRKSGIFSVKRDERESRIVFSNGYIVGANHINNSVRIGSVLVKMGAISLDDLRLALQTMRETAEKRTLIAVLLQLGKLSRDDAQRGLKKLVEMTIVDLMGWTKGSFTFDTDTVIYVPDGGEPVGIDAQMVLMDALRVFDERKRDEGLGKEVPSFENIYADVIPEEQVENRTASSMIITADDLGLGDLEKLVKKLPGPVSEMETFDPTEIHRRQIREILVGSSFDEQEAFVSFLKKAGEHKPAPGAAEQQEDKAVVMYSNDKLITHSFMTICKEERIPVFAVDDETDLERTISQCLSSRRMPVVILDCPAQDDENFAPEKIIRLRSRVKSRYSGVPILQLAPGEVPFMLQAYLDGATAVFPKPSKELRRETYVQDTIAFLSAVKSYIKAFEYRTDTTDKHLKVLKSEIKSLREATNPSDAALVMLAAVAEMFERAITFFVRATDLAGERAIGVKSEKSLGPVRVDWLKISLAKQSVFKDVLEKGQAVYGEISDEAIKDLFRDIDAPVSPAVALLPVICDRKVIAVIYGDFGAKEASPVHLDLLEILAQQVGIVLEYALFRRQMAKAAPKS